MKLIMIPEIIRKDLIESRKEIPFRLEIAQPIKQRHLSEKDFKLEFAYQRYLIKKIYEKI